MKKSFTIIIFSLFFTPFLSVGQTSESLFQEGCSMFDLGEVEGSLQKISSAIEKDSTHPGLYNMRGVINFSLKNFEEAERDYSKAISLDPSMAFAYYNRGTLHHAQYDFEQAIENYDAAIARYNKDADFFYNRAMAKNKNGQKEAAVADFQHAILLDPEHKEAYHELSLALHKLGNEELACESLKRGHELGYTTTPLTVLRVCGREDMIRMGAQDRIAYRDENPKKNPAEKKYEKWRRKASKEF